MSFVAEKVVLSQLAQRYANEMDDYIGLQILPVIPTPVDTFNYSVFTKKDAYTLPSDKVGKYGEAPEVGISETESESTCLDHAFKMFISNKDIRNVGNKFNLRNEYLRQLMNKKLGSMEKEIVDLVFSGTYITNNTSLAGADRWDDPSSDVVNQFETYKDQTFFEANLCVIGYDVFKKLKTHPQVREQLKYTQTPSANDMKALNAMSDFFGIKILVGKPKYNTANPGQTASYSRLWGKKALFAYVDPNPNMEGKARTATLGRTAIKNIGQGGALPYKVTNWDVQGEDKGAEGGEYIRVASVHIPFIQATDLGYLVQTVVS